MKIKQAGVISIKVPIISNRILMINNITYLLLLILSIASETADGIPVNAITHDMILDTPIRKIMIPDISALSLIICGTSLMEIDL